MKSDTADVSNIGQFDGNDTIVSESDIYSSKSDKITSALHMPVVATYNMRSIFPKLGNLKKDILERDIQAAFCCEIWEKSESKQHQFEIEKMLESEGLKYISTPRPTGWGGAAIIVNQEKFWLEKMNIHIPHNLEVIWGLLKPKDVTATFKKILLCSFYSPPNSRKNSKLTDHIVTTLQMLSTQYPDSPMILGADRNSMDITPILNCGLRLKQVVDLPTRKNKIHDIIIMNTPELYKSPIIVPPVPCDVPSAGLPSDHSVPVCIPHTDRHTRPARKYRTITHRPLPDAAINKFGQWITAETWDNLVDDLPSSEQAQQLEDILMDKLNKYCPLKTFKLSNRDKAWMNLELKKLDRKKMREWRKNGKTEKYERLLSEFDKKYRAAAEKYMRKKIDALKQAKPGKAFKILKSMGAQPGDCTDDQTFTLPSHQSEGLSDKESAEKIADYFAAISSEYQPLNVDLLPERVRLRLSTKSTPPVISELDCYQKIVAAKKPQSGVPGDLPNTIIKEFSVELAKPLEKLLNQIVQTATWPAKWKIEYVTPIGKIPQPECEDDLRPIALTAFFSKVMEQFVVMWLLEVIGDKLDFRQYGGTKGNSVSHYLIELINFILFNQDNTEATSVLACLVDFSKAFNRQDHSILVTKLSDMGVPPWLLKVVISFLTDRKMFLRYKGETSGIRSLPGGGPQGALLGLFLFLVLINDVGFSDQKNNNGDIITCKKRVKQFNELHLKYVDDLLLAEAISMKTQLHEVPVESRPQPDTYHERTGHNLSPGSSKVYNNLKKTEKYAAVNKMKLNYKKTKLMVFNPGKARDFLPRFTFNNKELEVVEETTLLGVIIRSDLSWGSNTSYMVHRANKKLWCLRRLKKLGASTNDLVDVYVKQVRSILEFAVAVWHPGLTNEDRLRIERVQKSAFGIILGQKYKSYRSALRTLQMESLFARRNRMCRKFANKALKHSKFEKWFKPNTSNTVTRAKPTKFCDVYSRTERFKRSPISFLTQLLNRK